MFKKTQQKDVSTKGVKAASKVNVNGQPKLPAPPAKKTGNNKVLNHLNTQINDGNNTLRITINSSDNDTDTEIIYNERRNELTPLSSTRGSPKSFDYTSHSPKSPNSNNDNGILRISKKYNFLCFHNIKEYNIPYIPVVIMLIIFITFFGLIISNKIKSGTIVSVLSILSLVPIVISFMYYNNIIKELNRNYNDRYEDNKKKHKIIKKMQDKMKKHQNIIHDLKNEVLYLKAYADSNNKSKNMPKMSLLQGFRKGQMEVQLELCDIYDLVNMLQVVISCITLLPFGMTRLRRRMKKILETKINSDPYLKQTFQFYLYSNIYNYNVQRLFRRHKLYKIISEIHKNIGPKNMNVPIVAMKSFISINSPTETSVDVVGTYPDITVNSVLGMPGSYSMNKYGSIKNLNLDDRKINIISPSFKDDQDNDTIQPVIGTTKGNPMPLSKIIDTDKDKTPKIFEVNFNDRDPIKLFWNFFDVKINDISAGFQVNISKKYRKYIFDPINGRNNVSNIKIAKVFNTNAKPLLLELKCEDPTTKIVTISSQIILKKGDDIRKDNGVILMFKYMNQLWKDNGLKFYDKDVQAITYKCVPMGPDFGCIEFIPNCIELNKINSIKNLYESDFSMLNSLIATAAGSYIASFVLGIRDRHSDNILIRTDNGSLFHIDFGYSFGAKVSIDTNKLAITKDLSKVMGNKYKNFVDIATQAYMILRTNSQELIDYASVVFNTLHNASIMDDFLRDSLKIDMTIDAAQEYMDKKLREAPNKVKTKVKNLVHGIAQRMKGGTM